MFLIVQIALGIVGAFVFINCLPMMLVASLYLIPSVIAFITCVQYGYSPSICISVAVLVLVVWAFALKAIMERNN